MTRIFLGLSVCFFLWASLALVCMPYASQARAEERRLGLSAPLSGGGAGWGNDVRNVLIFANEKLAAGQYKLIFEDDKCDPKTSLSVARKLTAVDHVQEVFIVCGQSVIGAAQAYRSAGVTVMASLATPSRISRLGVFRTSLSDANAAELLANYILRNHRRVAVFTEENEYPVSLLNDFVSSAKKIGLEVSNENYLPQQQDFRSQLMRLKSSGVEALFLNTQTEEALLSFVKQLREIHYAPQLYGAYLPGSATFLKLGADLAAGIVFVDFPGAPELLNDQGKAFYAEYLKRFGPLQGWSFAFPATFEAFRAIHLAAQSGEPVESFLRHTEFDGLFGKYRFDANGDIIGPRHVLRKIEEGHVVSVEP